MPNSPHEGAAAAVDGDAWKSLLYRVFDESPVGISLTAPNGQLGRINSAFASMLGYDHAELQAKGVADVTHPDDVAASRTLIGQLLAQKGGEGRVTKRYLHKDGRIVWADVSTVLLRDAAGEPLHFVTHIRDITEWRRAEDELRQHRDQLDSLVVLRTAELARSNKELEQFAVIASHDLKEPLRKIQAFGDILQQDFAQALSSEGRDYLGRMTTAAARLQRMIDSLLLYSRVTTHAKPFAHVSLHPIALQVVSELEPRIAQTGASVTVGALPTVWGDALQLHQLVQNLVGNALKFVEAGQRPQIEVTAIADDGRVKLVVQDNGIGIDAQFHGKIFGMFQRLHAPTAYEGSGIGLAVCQKIVERHGGAIAVHSTPGHGTRFEVTLPASNPTPGQ